MSALANGVAVFFARPDALDDTRRAEALGELPAEDVAHVGRFRFERDRDIALASRTIQRRALSRYTPVAPAAWKFTTGEHGKPEITPASQLRFNVSNTHGLVGCAVTLGRDIGFDVERYRDDAPLDLIDSHFAPAERAALLALPEAARPRRFFELWTLKESYIKARGLGLALPLDRFSFDFETEVPRLSVDPALEDDAVWQLALWSPTPTHLAALCVRRDNAPPLAIELNWDVV